MIIFRLDLGKTKSIPQEEAVLQELADRLGRTKLGRMALDQPDGWVFLRQKPTGRFYVGLSLILSSHLISLPAFALVGYLSVSWEEPWIAVLGVPAVFIAVHLIFILGAFLAGGNYTKHTFLWACKLFLLKFGTKEPSSNPSG